MPHQPELALENGQFFWNPRIHVFKTYVTQTISRMQSVQSVHIAQAKELQARTDLILNAFKTAFSGFSSACTSEQNGSLFVNIDQCRLASWTGNIVLRLPLAGEACVGDGRQRNSKMPCDNTYQSRNGGDSTCVSMRALLSRRASNATMVTVVSADAVREFDRRAPRCPWSGHVNSGTESEEGTMGESPSVWANRLRARLRVGIYANRQNPTIKTKARHYARQRRGLREEVGR